MIETKFNYELSRYSCEICKEKFGLPFALPITIGPSGQVVDCPICSGQVSLEEFRIRKHKKAANTEVMDDDFWRDVAGVLRKVCHICNLKDTCLAKDFCFRGVRDSQWRVCPEGRITEEHYNNSVKAVTTQGCWTVTVNS